METLPPFLLPRERDKERKREREGRAHTSPAGTPKETYKASFVKRDLLNIQPVRIEAVVNQQFFPIVHLPRRY